MRTFGILPFFATLLAEMKKRASLRAAAPVYNARKKGFMSCLGPLHHRSTGHCWSLHGKIAPASGCSAHDRGPCCQEVVCRSASKVFHTNYEHPLAGKLLGLRLDILDAGLQHLLLPFPHPCCTCLVGHLKESKALHNTLCNKSCRHAPLSFSRTSRLPSGMLRTRSL